MYKKSITGGIILLFLLSSSVSFVSSYEVSTNNIIYVDDDGGADYTRIQDAIDNASDGNTVYVYSGTYYENIILNKSITLEGEDCNTTIIDGQKIDDVIHLTGNSTIIRGFTIMNARNGQNSDDAGIDIRSYSNIIMDNIIFDNILGIYFQVLDSNNIITNNVFDDNSLGLKLRFTSETIVSNNSFVDNYRGMRLEYVDHVNISGNTIVGEFIEGMRLDNAYSCEISTNYIFIDGSNLLTIILDSSCSNLIDNNYIENKKNRGIGISLTWLSNGNILKKNIIKNFDYGINIFAGSGGNIITRNIIEENSKGIHFVSECKDNTISENTIANNSQYGIHFEFSGVYESKIHHNNFLNNNIHSNAKGVNNWDDGLKGNYWDDYEEKYPDAHKKWLKGIWDTPYEIASGNNQDRYPLIKPYSKSKSYVNPLFQQFLDQHPHMFPLLRQLLRL